MPMKLKNHFSQLIQEKTSMLEKLKDKGYLVLDGAMGSNLFLLGLISGDSPEAWNLEHPDRVKKVHQAFVQAGSDIILTNTFGGNRHRLKLHQLENQVVEVNRAAVKLARECRRGTRIQCFHGKRRSPFHTLIRCA